MKKKVNLILAIVLLLAEAIVSCLCLWVCTVFLWGFMGAGIVAFILQILYWSGILLIGILMIIKRKTAMKKLLIVMCCIWGLPILVWLTGFWLIGVGVIVFPG